MRPFGWTAGKTLFKWFAGIGLDEDTFRQRVYMCQPFAVVFRVNSRRVVTVYLRVRR
ncbi:MAG: hypothetical protein QJT81_08250 [Candidatus Thiothrix putei]|uniref:Uncharacterized protein n=1 Tax=Candidatus Thiothrix putei TaxID=3080811 RepID=A0AA95HMF7_9GAMM|nr:MAG: hypothetical protein QJT81_08250 [Candidatus Thiothrix putei]